MSKISFFNKAVFKRNLKGYWPLWAVYLGAMLFTIPLPLYTNLQYGYYENSAGIISSYFEPMLTFSLVFGAFFSIFAAMALFSYMYTPRAANMTASLPIKRDALFGTNFITILFVTVAVHVITAVVTALTIAACNPSYLFVLPILQWLLLGTLMTLFFICLSCFCATLTGSLLILPCIYGVINFSVILLNSILSYIFTEFLYGYTYDALPTIVKWLTPSVNLYNAATNSHTVLDGANYVSFGGYKEVIVYTVVAFLLLILAFFIHRSRRTESAADIIAVKPLKPVVKYFFAAVGSLVLGVVINEIIFYYQGSIASYIISMVIGGFIGYFASEMLVSKSFRIWHKWKGFAVYCVVIILFITSLAFDVTGYETNIPRKEDIEFSSVKLYGYALEGDDPETADLAVALHEYIVENKDTEVNYEREYATVRLEYQLDNGAIIKREYFCNLPEFIVNEFNSPQQCYDRVKVSDEFTITGVVDAYVEYYDDDGWQHFALTDVECADLYAHMKEDIGSSSLGRLFFGNDLYETAVSVHITFKISEYSGEYYYYQTIPFDAANSIAYLKTLGIDAVTVY